MKKKIILSVVLVMVIGLSYLGYGLYKSYVKPYIISTKYTAEELEKEATDDKKTIEAATGLTLREMSEEEKAAIEKGEITESEVMEQIIKDAAENKPVKKGNPDAISAKYLSEIYALQGKYTGAIENLITEIRAHYYSLRIDKKYKVDDAISATTKIYMPKIEAYEAECDGKIKNILARLEKELKANNCDTSIVGKIKQGYEKEKEIKSAYYIKLLTKRK